MNPKKILFISHDANRTGAPILLLRFIKLLVQLPQYDCTILSGKNGPLIQEFENTCKTYIWEPEFLLRPKSDTLNYYFKASKLDKIRGKIKLNLHKKNLLATIKSKKFDLIVANTIASSSIAQAIVKIGYNNITSYIHELQFGLNSFVGIADRDFLLTHSNNFWVPSNAVKINLHKNHLIPLENIELLVSANETKIDFNEYDLIQNKKSSKIIGCVGTFDFRKGADIFINVAKNIIESHIENITFIWYGADLNSDYYKHHKKQIDVWGLQSKIIIKGNTKNILEEMSQFDIFLLTSREDPYPLVILEAAILAIPIIAFDENAGGTVELIENGAGIVVPFLNIAEMTKQCKFLIENENARIEIGQNGKEKVIKKHDAVVVKETFLKIIKNLLN